MIYEKEPITSQYCNKHLLYYFKECPCCKLIREFLEDLKNPSIHTFEYLIRKWEEKLKK
jgi:hypothetical protein